MNTVIFDLDGTLSDLLRDMINDSALSSRPMIMIGDRDSDFIAAGETGMPSLAVSWGYGSEEEYKHATAVVEKPEDLTEAIMEYAGRV